jgi:hypothetical protein
MRFIVCTWFFIIFYPLMSCGDPRNKKPPNLNPTEPIKKESDQSGMVWERISKEEEGKPLQVIRETQRPMTPEERE